jgi:membrane-bound hydrogenase subunit beta
MMTSKTILTPDEIIKSYKDTFKEKILDARIEKHVRGINKNEFFHIWLKIDRSIYKNVVKHLFTFETYPHFAVSSGYDLGDSIELVHHFSLYYGEKLRDISVNITVSLPKNDLTIDTITDLIPGALIAEQEKQEMLGVKVIGIPKDERVFIPKEFPKNTYPWRRDETGAEKIMRNLHDKVKE